MCYCSRREGAQRAYCRFGRRLFLDLDTRPFHRFSDPRQREFVDVLSRPAGEYPCHSRQSESQTLLYSSEDGGATFHTDTLQLAVKTLRRGNASLTNRRGDPRGGQDRIYSTPGREGDLWIAAYDGLYHSTTRTGFDFRALDKVRTIYAFGFGKAKPGSNYPALYLIGVVNGQYGFFRSDDAAVSWMRINDDAHQYGLVLHICGDMQEYGRVYIGTHGRGIVTGVPSSD